MNKTSQIFYMNTYVAAKPSLNSSGIFCMLLQRVWQIAYNRNRVGVGFAIYNLQISSVCLSRSVLEINN
jgi:hypothetical protein